MDHRRKLLKALPDLLGERSKTPDSNHEAALAYHLKGEAYRWKGVECNACHDMSWRRAPCGCVECHKPYAPERAEHEVPEMSSSFGLVVDGVW